MSLTCWDPLVGLSERDGCVHALLRDVFTCATLLLAGVQLHYRIDKRFIGSTYKNGVGFFWEGDRCVVPHYSVVRATCYARTVGTFGLLLQTMTRVYFQISCH